MNLSFGEILLILAVALVVFGPDKLPEIGKNLGRAMRSFRSASQELQKELRSSLDFVDDAEPKPTKPADSRNSALPPPPPPVLPTTADSKSPEAPNDGAGSTAGAE